MMTSILNIASSRHFQINIADRQKYPLKLPKKHFFCHSATKDICHAGLTSVRATTSAI